MILLPFIRHAVAVSVGRRRATSEIRPGAAVADGADVASAVLDIVDDAGIKAITGGFIGSYGGEHLVFEDRRWIGGDCGGLVFVQLGLNTMYKQQLGDPCTLVC